MNEEILKAVCPHCKEALRIRKPSEAGRHNYRCPQCRKIFAIDVKGENKEPETAETAQTHDIGRQRGDVLQLFMQRRLRPDKKLVLRIGDNTIGTVSAERPSDIMINDSYISRRSATISVEMLPDSTFRYLFTLNRTTNPAYYNNSPLPSGASFYMKDGDTFKLGKSTFYIKA